MKLQYIPKIPLLVIFLYGCVAILGKEKAPTVSPNLLERSFLTGVPCAAPCWHNLEVGKSHESDVIARLQTLEFIDQKTIRVSEKFVPDFNPAISVKGKEIKAKCIYGSTLCLILNLAGSKLRDVRIMLNYELRMDTVIEHLGSPDYVGIERLSTDRLICRIELVWGRKQLVMFSAAFSGYEGCRYSYAAYTSGKIDLDLMITELRYLPIEDIDAIIINVDRFSTFKGLNP